jgi:hypothetical protein
MLSDWSAVVSMYCRVQNKVMDRICGNQGAWPNTGSKSRFVRRSKNNPKIESKHVDTRTALVFIRTRWGDALAVLTKWLGGAEQFFVASTYFLVFSKLP